MKLHAGIPQMKQMTADLASYDRILLKGGVANG